MIRLLTILLLFSNLEFTERQVIMNQNPIPKLHETTCQSIKNGQIKIKEIKQDRSSKTYGYSIWIKPKSNIGICYFPIKSDHESVYGRYVDWQSDKKVILVSSGAYATAANEPIGLTIDNGAILNQRLRRDMDGIVVVHNGQIHIYNSKKRFHFEPLNKTLWMPDYKDKNQFTTWAKNNKATIFQTHLLIYNNHLRIAPNSKKKFTKRKMLALLRDGAGHTHNAIFYLASGEYLLDGTKKLRKYLNEAGFQVDKMINLDTGINNILEVNEAIRTCNGATVRGKNNMQAAKNLLSFYWL